MIDETVHLLLEQQNSDGGWGSVKGRISNTECTAFSVIALGSLQRKELTPLIQNGLRWLLRQQNSDGSWPLNDRTPGASWSTAIALLCLSTFPEYHERASKAVDWALAQEGKRFGWIASLIMWFTGQREVNRINMDLKGWPWASGTFSWVEPTSYFLIGLKRMKSALRSTKIDDRIRQGELLIYDRVCEGGGWNYGNSKIYGEALWPYPDITAVALIALQDHRNAEINMKSLQELEKNLKEVESGLALSWSIICFSLYERKVSEWQKLLVKNFERTGFLGETKPLALSILAMTEAPQFFRI